MDEPPLPLPHPTSRAAIKNMTVRDTALLLAREHIANDAGTTDVFWAPHERDVLLVEVSTSVEDQGEVLPFRFAADPPEVPYESVVILLSPGDWKLVQERTLALPEGFTPLEVIAEAKSAATGS